MYQSNMRTVSKNQCIVWFFVLAVGVVGLCGQAVAADKKKPIDLSLSVMWGSKMAFVSDIIPNITAAGPYGTVIFINSFNLFV